MGLDERGAVFVAVYTAEDGRESSFDTIAVCSTLDAAKKAIGKHAVVREGEGYWFVEQWVLDGSYIGRDPIYPDLHSERGRP